MIKQCEKLEEAAESNIDGGIEALVSTLNEWQTRNREIGLETGEQLRALLDAGGKGRPYDVDSIVRISKLHKTIDDSTGKCIWVKNEGNDSEDDCR